WAKLAGQRDRTLVFYMGLSQAQEISEGLVRNGLTSTTPVALISNGGTADQRTVRCTLETLPWAALSNSVVSPCLIVVGAVVNLAHPHSAVRYRRQEPARWAASIDSILCSPTSRAEKSCWFAVAPSQSAKRAYYLKARP